MSRNEAQTRRDLIDPKLFLRGWKTDLVKVEVTPGGTDIVEGKPRRRKGRTDYLLCVSLSPGLPSLPIAVLEAKKEDSSASLGLQQAQGYAKRFHVPFAFSSNGTLYTEYGEDTTQILDDKDLDSFPTPEELRARYEAYKHFQLKSAEAKALFVRYKTGESTRFYFQDAAIRAVLEKLAGGEKKILLSLATGTGKTFIAKELLWKLASSGQLRRALFLVDRDELRTQAITHLQGIFGDDAKEVTTTDPPLNAKILIATYQTLNIVAEDQEPTFWKKNFPKNFFSHIIIDECHRSAWGKWSVVLKDNPDAIHIGLTATPRKLTGEDNGEDGNDDELITQNNITYFGEPVYEYTISDGQNDGYLAACEVILRKPNIDSETIKREILKLKKVVDAHTGKKVTEQDLKDEYTSRVFESQLLIDDRILSMCTDLFNLFLQHGSPHQKTIIFCAGELHAEKVAITLNNLYSAWCTTNGAEPKALYAFKCTAESKQPSSKELIAELRGSASSHFIATTAELLSTGIDIPNLNNVVFFKYVKSPISFYQMVGRGTRVGEPRYSKLMFRLFDYTNATRLFGKDFISKPYEEGEPKEKPEPRKIIRVEKEQFTVEINDEGKSILCEENGVDVLVPYETYKERLAAALSEKIPTLEILKTSWVNPVERKELLQQLPGGEMAVRLVRELEEEQECDLYDTLAHLGYGSAPKTRNERAGGFSFRNKPWLKLFPEQTQRLLVAVAAQFAKGGIEELEVGELFDVADVKKDGGLQSLYGLPYKPEFYIHETKLRLLA